MPRIFILHLLFNNVFDTYIFSYFFRKPLLLFIEQVLAHSLFEVLLRIIVCLDDLFSSHFLSQVRKEGIYLSLSVLMLFLDQPISLGIFAVLDECLEDFGDEVMLVLRLGLLLIHVRDSSFFF